MTATCEVKKLGGKSRWNTAQEIKFLGTLDRAAVRQYAEVARWRVDWGNIDSRRVMAECRKLLGRYHHAHDIWKLANQRNRTTKEGI